MGQLLDRQGFFGERVRTLSSGQASPSTAACWCFDPVPSFPVQICGATIDHADHAERWSRTGIDYDLAARNSTVGLGRGGKKLAVTADGHEWDGLYVEPAFDRKLGG